MLSKINRLLSSIGVEMHFIDAEWASTDPTPPSLFPLLEEQRNVTLVLTISVRRSDAENRIKELINMVQSYHNLQPCLVPGNPAYLSPYELCKNSVKLIEDYAKTIRKIYDGVMYIGCEKFEKASARISKHFSMTMFHLYRRSRLNEFLSFSSEGSIAIYTPVILDNLSDTAKSYIARRVVANNSEGDFTKHAIDEYMLSLTNSDTYILEYLGRRRVMLVIQPFSNSMLEIQKVFREIERLANKKGIT